MASEGKARGRAGGKRGAVEAAAPDGLEHAGVVPGEEVAELREGEAEGTDLVIPGASLLEE